jgi:hypothetical protein
MPTASSRAERSPDEFEGAVCPGLTTDHLPFRPNILLLVVEGHFRCARTAGGGPVGPDEPASDAQHAGPAGDNLRQNLLSPEN